MMIEKREIEKTKEQLVAAQARTDQMLAKTADAIKEDHVSYRKVIVALTSGGFDEVIRLDGKCVAMAGLMLCLGGSVAGVSICEQMLAKLTSEDG